MNPDYALVTLIRCYLRAAESACTRLRAAHGVRDLLAAVCAGKIPREGVLDEHTSFRFHGVGFEFRCRGVGVEVDLGPDGRCDGFDAWRLSLFAEQSPELARSWPLARVEAGLEALLNAGVVHEPKWSPSPHLLYFVDGMKNGPAS